MNNKPNPRLAELNLRPITMDPNAKLDPTWWMTPSERALYMRAQRQQDPRIADAEKQLKAINNLITAKDAPWWTPEKWFQSAETRAQLKQLQDARDWWINAQNKFVNGDDNAFANPPTISAPPAGTAPLPAGTTPPPGNSTPPPPPIDIPQQGAQADPSKGLFPGGQPPDLLAQQSASPMPQSSPMMAMRQQLGSFSKPPVELTASNPKTLRLPLARR